MEESPDDGSNLVEEFPRTTGKLSVYGIRVDQ